MCAKKFILIDHSLEKVGGHNYEYAVHIGQAAEKSGRDVVLAVHRHFREQEKVPKNWPVYPLYPFNSFNNRYSLYKSGQLWSPAPPTNVHGIARRLYYAWRGYRGTQLLNQFEHACDQLFRQVSLVEGDIVFVPTLSEFDLLGLVQYLRNRPQSRKAVWFLQFHFDLFQGRTPEYRDQKQKFQALREFFLKAFSELAEHRVVLLSPTKSVADQYNRLGLATFHELAYPVSSAFCPTSIAVQSKQPVSIVLAGHFRQEKGRYLLGPTLKHIWRDTLSVGRAQLMIQGRASRIRSWLPQSLRSKVSSNRANPKKSSKPVVAVRHPLSPEDYVEYIRQAGIGLFLYDNRRYFARCSGVLVEMLASGVPVIVPAGCWLAEQVAEAIYEHQDGLLNQLSLIGRTASSSLLLSGSDRPTTVELPIPPDAKGLLVRFRCQSPWPDGTYVRITSHVSGSTRESQRLANIVGNRVGRERVPVWIPLASGSRHIQLRWSNAYHHGRIVCCDVQFCFLGKDATSSAHTPWGAVGLIAAEPGDTPLLIDEMLNHYDHYRKTAVQFASVWQQKHSVGHVFQDLLSWTEALPPLGEPRQCNTQSGMPQRKSA